jgi:hypothetical protein
MLKVDSGIGLPMENVLESTLKWTLGEIIVNSGIESHTPRFSLDPASVLVQCTHVRVPLLPRESLS